MHNMFGRWEVRIPHSEIDNIFSPSPCLDLQPIHDAEDIGREPRHSLKSKIIWTKRNHHSDALSRMQVRFAA